MTLLPGTGFDVAPTGCLVIKIVSPDASFLQLVFARLGSGLSYGTASSLVNRLGEKMLKEKIVK